MLKIALIMFHAIARTEMQRLFVLFVKIRNIFRHIRAANWIAEKFLRGRSRWNARRFTPVINVRSRRPVNGLLHYPGDSRSDDEPHKVAKNPSKKLQRCLPFSVHSHCPWGVNSMACIVSRFRLEVYSTRPGQSIESGQ